LIERSFKIFWTKYLFRGILAAFKQQEIRVMARVPANSNRHYRAETPNKFRTAAAATRTKLDRAGADRFSMNGNTP